MRDPKGPGGRVDRSISQSGRQAVEETPQASTEDRPIKQILQDILTNMQEIIRNEVRLARTEIGEEMSKALRALAILGGGMFLAVYALGFLLLSAVYALAAVLPDWLAPLLVGLLVAVGAAILIMVGRNRLAEVNAKPEKTIQSVKEDVQWVKDQTK
jgi:uncharacterized membrane protein YqjE